MDGDTVNVSANFCFGFISDLATVFRARPVNPRNHLAPREEMKK
jgi:hypothetical protein